MERKLTAILCADVFGYSRLMGENDQATLRTLSSYRKLIDSELLPGGLLGESVPGPYEFKRHGIAEEEKFTRVKCEDFGELAQDLVRRMALAGFEIRGPRRL